MRWKPIQPQLVHVVSSLHTQGKLKKEFLVTVLKGDYKKINDCLWNHPANTNIQGGLPFHTSQAATLKVHLRASYCQFHECRVLLEMLTVAQLVKKWLTLWNPNVHYVVCNDLQQICILSQINPFHFN